MRNNFVILAVSISLAFAGQVHVNQIGFGTSAQKQAVYVNDGGAPGTITLKSVDAGTVNKTVTPGAKGSWTHSYSGEASYILNFTDVTTPGHYAFFEGNAKISPIFQIGVSYDELTKGALKFFYYHRADLELKEPYAEGFARAAGHSNLKAYIYDINGNITSEYITSYRGWYDAGDYGRYVVNSGISTYTLLALYEKYANKVPDLNNPTDPTFPDLLAEIKWNLDWMLSMQATDGGVYHKMTGINFSGTVFPANDNALPLVVTWKTTAATLNFAAVMAVASRIYKDYDPSYANQMLTKAKLAWNWANANPAVLYSSITDPTKTGAYTDNYVNDEFFFAAAALATVTDGFEQNEFITHITNNGDYYGGFAGWADVGSLGTLEIVRNQAKFSSPIISAAKNALIEYSDEYLSYVTTGYGLPFDHIFWWGSNSVAANIGIMLIEAGELTNQSKYKNAAQSILDYILGRNPLAQSYVTGFGSNPAAHTHDRLSESYGKTIPGQLAGGPANTGCMGEDDFSTALATQYRDDYNCYGWNEIAINWNAPLAYLLAALSESGSGIEEMNLETVIFHYEDSHRGIARTGEVLYNFIVQNNDGEVSISNENNPISAEGYVEILDVEVEIPSWDDWAQASIGLETKHNGDHYDLAQCDGGFSYTYKGNAHRFSLNSKDSENKQITFYQDIDNSSSWTTVTVNSFARDPYDESLDPSTSPNLSTVNDIHWSIRPTDLNTEVTGELQISEIKCLGLLQLPSLVPTITGPASMARLIGYAATSTEPFTITGPGDIDIELVECGNCNGKITWNETTKKLDIATGLPVGTYTVTLKATNSMGTKEHTFTLTVSTPTPPVISADITLPAGEVDAAYSATLTATGTQPIVWTVKTGTSLPEGLELSANGIISGTPTTEGVITFTVVATNDYGSVEQELSIVITPKPIVPIIAGIPKANTLKAYIQNGTLHLSGLTAGKAWSVYTASGTLVHKGIASGSEESLHLNASGIYFVKSNGHVSRPLTNYAN